MAIEIWVNIDLGNVLLLGGTKPLPADLSSKLSYGVHLRTISQEVLMIYIR